MSENNIDNNDLKYTDITGKEFEFTVPIENINIKTVEELRQEGKPEHLSILQIRDEEMTELKKELDEKITETINLSTKINRLKKVNESLELLLIASMIIILAFTFGG